MAGTTLITLCRAAARGLVCGALLFAPSPALAATLAVGSGKTHAKPCEAFAAAEDGDVIEIDAGTYAGDVCAVARSRLLIRGVGGRAHIEAAGAASGGKGTWVIQGDSTTVENIELSGAKVPDKNGAGIRLEGHGLVVRNCYFHDNEDGILTGGGGDVIIEGSEFANNGAGDGYSHNMYIGHELTFTLRWSYSHHAKIGHLVKSRAAKNFIFYNRLMDEADGTSSYTIDLPNGGTSLVVGNLIQQGPRTDNAVILAYAEEGLMNPGSDLYLVNNTFVNDRGSGTFVQIAADALAPAILRNNVFFGGGTVTNQKVAMLEANLVATDPMLVDRAGFDYHLRPGSPCVNAGVDPGMAITSSLAPLFEYVHPTGHRDRATVGAIDIGAYEVGAAASSMDAGPAGGGAGGGSGAAAGAGDDAAAGRAAAGAASSSGGCACALDRLGSRGTSPFAALAALGLAVVISRRRRRR